MSTNLSLVLDEWATTEKKSVNSRPDFPGNVMDKNTIEKHPEVLKGKSPDTRLVGTPRKVWFYVGRVNHSTTVESVHIEED